MSTDLLIADFEALREHLGLRRWAVLGHSAGGATALEYAVSRPESVDEVIFDCPCWDADLTDRFRLSIAAARLRERGNEAAARRCEQIAMHERRITLRDGTYEAMQELDEEYMSLFLYDRKGLERYGQVRAASQVTKEQEQRGMSHQPLLEDMYRSRLHLLADLRVPSMVIRGAADLVSAPEAIRTYREQVPDALVHTLPVAAHFPDLESPVEYRDLVTAFVLRHADTALQSDHESP